MLEEIIDTDANPWNALCNMTVLVDVIVFDRINSKVAVLYSGPTAFEREQPLNPDSPLRSIGPRKRVIEGKDVWFDHTPRLLKVQREWGTGVDFDLDIETSGQTIHIDFKGLLDSLQWV